MCIYLGQIRVVLLNKVDVDTTGDAGLVLSQANSGWSTSPS